MQADHRSDGDNRRYIAHKDAVACDIGSEKALLNLESGTYFTLNPSASVIWTLLQKPCTAPELCDALTDRYEIAADACAADVDVILSQLKAAGLVGDATA